MQENYLRLLGVSCDAHGVEVSAAAFGPANLAGKSCSPQPPTHPHPHRSRAILTFPEAAAFVSVRRHGLSGTSDLALELVAEVLTGFAGCLGLSAPDPRQVFDGVVFNAGPGGFTAVRSACALAQGLAFGWNKPVAAVSSLESWAVQIAQDGPPAEQDVAAARILVILDARMHEVYVGLFDATALASTPGTLKLQGEAVLSPSQLPEWLESFESVPSGSYRVAGGNFLSSDPTLRDALVNTGWEVLLFAHDPPTPLKSQAMLSVASARRSDIFQSARSVGPRYVRNKVALNSMEQQALRDQHLLKALSPKSV